MSRLTDTALSRRHFLRGSFLNTLKNEQIKRQGYQPIYPPWADITNFLQKCTQCNQCITACETQILIKGANGYPEIDFTQGKQECTFCQACVQSCPEPIFRSTDENAWQHKIEIKPNCLAKNGIECRSCQDNCEARAIKFKREIGKVSSPILALELCNGCGACLSTCPSQSITILHL
ncbi:ferredoxin-type protein NapF [Vespertiliibacter pulmonis]|uniref:Ferredoxin-type protein NapF n=1 Tax=Vespertiliibacter pulmonis TaxID=1443036 RepID=A0A3N4W361_9PAST|nr:ferredoxin-type protein NapF [Vespertiliibacter pulmonis]QLB21017.1 ferredoxin-type protein NapF [Vespertiliibacter pulmonis]RPE83887.1 ferredoxin-type protein NapF [Vespertiliibacter pulmonis]